MGTNRRKHGGKKKSGKAAAPKPEPAADEPLEWVGCDACGKWRKIPLSIAEALGDDDEWFCKMNPDEAMAKLGCVAPEPEDTHDDETEPEPMEVEETPAGDAPVAMGWVGCDACYKWRKVPQLRCVPVELDFSSDNKPDVHQLADNRDRVTSHKNHKL